MLSCEPISQSKGLNIHAIGRFHALYQLTFSLGIITNDQLAYNVETSGCFFKSIRVVLQQKPLFMPKNVVVSKLSQIMLSLEILFVVYHVKIAAKK